MEIFSQVPVCEVKFLRSLFRELGYKQCESTVIWEDNRSTALIDENECSSAGHSKHIDTRFKFVTQVITDFVVRLCRTPSEMNLADNLTKTSPKSTFETLRPMYR